MKKIITLCMAATLLYACNDKDDNKGPVYGEKAEVETVDAAQDALNQGSSEITIKEALTSDSALAIPKNYDSNEPLKITVPANGKNLTITEGTTGSGKLPVLTLNITDAKDLIVNTPDMSVTFNGDADVLTAYTAENTLTIAKDAEVGTLNVQKGNVRLFGDVATIGTVATGSNILYPVTTADELRKALTETPYNNKTNGGVVLMNNIVGVIAPDEALGGITGAQENQDVFKVGTPWTTDLPTRPTATHDGYIIDGNGFSISGAAYNNVLAIYANNVTVKNLTVLQTESQKNLQIWKNNALAKANNAGISVYRSTGANLTDVTVKDCGKYGVIINGSAATVTGITTSGNAWGGINVANGSAVTEKPSLNLVSASISEANPVYVETEADITVPTGWTNKTENGKTQYFPPATR